MKRDYTDLAIDLYGEAGRAAVIIERQVTLLAREDGDDKLTEREGNRLDSLVSALKHRASLTNIPEDQKTARIEIVRSAIKTGEYPEDHSQAMKEQNARVNEAKEAIKAHPKYSELVRLLQEHNECGGWEKELLEEILDTKTALNYSGETYPNHQAVACDYGTKIIKHNGKIRKLQADIALDLRLHPVIGNTWKGKRIVKGYELRHYWKPIYQDTERLAA